MKCTICNNGLLLKAEYTQSGPHVKMTCKLCKQFIKFVKKDDVIGEVKSLKIKPIL
jgi:hypothetical protein